MADVQKAIDNFGMWKYDWYMENKTFQVGDKVKWTGYTDAAGVVHQERAGLVVTAVKWIPCVGMPSYRRVTATGGKYWRVEAAERFFEREGAA